MTDTGTYFNRKICWNPLTELDIESGGYGYLNKKKIAGPQNLALDTGTAEYRHAGYWHITVCIYESEKENSNIYMLYII